MNKRELGYFDGIVEGRLIENGFFGIGNETFCCPIGDDLAIVTAPLRGSCTLEIYSNLPTGTEVEMNEYIKLVRNEGHQELFIAADIGDIIAVFKLYKESRCKK